MLCFDRKEGESFMIGNNITVKIERIIGDEITLGITAPRGVPVYRKEVYRRIQKEEKRKKRD